MKIYNLTVADLVSFGNYLLSDERKEKKMSDPEFNEEQKVESLKRVSHAEISNWLNEQVLELVN